MNTDDFKKAPEIEPQVGELLDWYGDVYGDEGLSLFLAELSRAVYDKGYSNGSPLAKTDPSFLAYYVEHPSIIAHAWLLGQYTNASTGEVEFVVSNKKSPN